MPIGVETRRLYKLLSSSTLFFAVFASGGTPRGAGAIGRLLWAGCGSMVGGKTAVADVRLVTVVAPAP